MKTNVLRLIACCSTLGVVNVAPAVNAVVDVESLKVPAGFSIELVAGPPLVERPIVASFDDEGRLYVAESSGSNDPVEKQLELRPHRILRLEDADGDGVFDRRTVYADKMMLPEGALFLDGSLFVSAPPSIWKFTDADDDGIAETRIEWFQGKTLTGCANDLHGPYLGPDGWLYWCKGAFATQTHVVSGREWTTQAAHIFRRRPEGGPLEPVMTGGMDNPVDVVFTPEGERIFSATYLVGEGRQDGLVHAIYGGVYGKQHGVLDGHPRTGDLMPALTLMRSAAPCGLERYESSAFGVEFRDNLFLCQFNLRKVSRHVLRPSGSSYTGEESPFVTSEHVDFHPTDVLTDADGSLIVIDTGGWYKLCCPTSHLWKPDVLGAIYRVRRIGAPIVDDPRGRRIAWQQLRVEELWSMLGDERFAVRSRANRELVRRRNSEALEDFVKRLAEGDGPGAALQPASASDANMIDARTAKLARVWTLAQLDGADAATLVRKALDDDDECVRHAAMHIVSLYRDAKAAPWLVEILSHDTDANRRIAAEALGRLGSASAVPHLLTAAANAAGDRILHHSIIYALIELADRGKTQAGLASSDTSTISAALIALDQMFGGAVASDQVIPLLNSSDNGLRETARWLVSRHAEWGADLADWFRTQLMSLNDRPPSDPAATGEESLQAMLHAFSRHPVIQELLADVAVDSQSSAARRTSLRVMAQSKLSAPTLPWSKALAGVIDEANVEFLPYAIEAANAITSAPLRHPDIDRALLAAAADSALSQELRVGALAAISPDATLSDGQFQLLVQGLSTDGSMELRSNSAEAISHAHLTRTQLSQLCEAVASAGPLEINRLLTAFGKSSDEQLAGRLLDSLEGATALASVRFDLLREALAACGPELQHSVDALEALINVDAAGQRQRIRELLPVMAHGDVRRGHAVFYSSKAACSACHQLGLGGGDIGPDLSHIGEIRTEGDLLESILYPSLSFVRSYEPVQILTVDGKVISGTIRDKNTQEYVLATGPDQETRVSLEDVEEIQPSTISTMPAGLDNSLTTQELADLVTFLKKTTE